MYTVKQNKALTSNPLPSTMPLLSFLLLFIILATCHALSDSTLPIALEGCHDRCGNISIPYPFGIGEKCSQNAWFQVSCDKTDDPPTPYLTALNWTGYKDQVVQAAILSIDVGRWGSAATNVPTLTILATIVTVRGRNSSDLFDFGKLDMRRSPYHLMALLNTFLVLGCDGSVGLKNSRNRTIAGCASVCGKNTSPKSGSRGCYGIGCCQTTVPISLDYIQMEFLNKVGDVNSQDVLVAAVVGTSYLGSKINLTRDLLKDDDSRPAILQWKVPNLPTNSPNYNNSKCVQNELKKPLQGYEYVCKCKYHYYQGNPYLPNGCQVIKECEKCPDDCIPAGGKNKFTCRPKDKKSALPIALGLGISLGATLLVIVLCGLYQLIRKRKEIRQKQSNFKKNGGLLLQQQMSASEGSIDKTKLFTCIELEKATDNFNENRILGRGGQGAVYKGMLADGTIVAIKKSKSIDENEQKHFINEVVILSKVNHRNIVKLFGCCLETEVPLLVYEYIPNGTLFQHIHDPSEDFHITWKMRLRIALESAEAIAYLHSSASTPIYHRDIKTTNILLDEKYKPKVSDFGTSKNISIDQTHVTTSVQGTFGYIDPEFYQTNQFTEKSDVYSFGIVLIELLTSKKPIYRDMSMESKSLASRFLLLMQDSCLHEIIDTNVLEEAQKEEVMEVANIARKCLNLNGRERPTMKEVAISLQMINSENGIPSSSSKIGKEDFVADQICMVDGGPFSISSTPALNDDPSICTQPSLFSNDSGI